MKFVTDKGLQPVVDAAVTDGLWRPRHSGFAGCSSDPSVAFVSQPAMVSGTQYVSRVKLDKAGVLTGVRFYCTTAATALTEATCDVFDSTGALLATANVATALSTNALASVNFAAPSRAMAAGEVVYVGLRCTFPSGTAPIVRGVSTSAFPNVNVSGANSRYGTAGTGVTSPLTSITPASITVGNVGAAAMWVGLI